jgi:probable phosphoglycerate mutase
VRHGQSAANAAIEQARRAGHEDVELEGRDADVPISPVGRLQAAALGRWLAGLSRDAGPEVVYVSSYPRARQTLETILEGQRTGSGPAGGSADG